MRHSPELIARITSAAALVLVSGTALAQTPAQSGVVSNPLASPVQPDVVSYERIVNDRGELVFVRIHDGTVFTSTRQQARSTRGNSIQLPGTAIGQKLTSYAGQLDWRPRQGPNDNGNAWFAYVASDDQGKVGLRINYVKAGGTLSDQEPLIIPFAEQVRSPRWSPDGKHLAFISERGILYTLPNVDQLMTSRNVALAKPSPVNQATRPAYFPAWSPYGDHIAYSVEVTPRGGVKHGAIEVVPVVKVTGLVDARAVPVVVTAEMTSDNEYRPSWSKDAKYIAFYADQAGLGGSNTKVSIGVVEVVTNARTGNVFRGEVREGKERWLADNVIPDETRGPAWSSLLEGMSKKDVLLYVERKSAGANAVMAAGLDRFLSKSPRSEYETEMSGGWNVANPKWVTAAELNQMVRYVYTSVASGGEVVANYDQAARWSTGPDPVLSGGRAVASAPAAGGGRAAAPTQAAPTEAIIIVHRGQDVLRALLFPGMGQHSYGGTGKGIALNVLGVAGAGVALLGYSGMSGPLSDGKAAVDAVTRDPNTVTANRDKYNTAQTAFNSKQSQFSAGAGLYLAAWAYGILDASFKSAPGSGSGLSLTPEITPSRSGSSLGMRLGYSVPLGQRPR